MEEMLGKREASGWVAGSVSLLGDEKDKTSVAMTILVLRGHPTVEVFFAEAGPHVVEIFVVDQRVPRLMSRTDSARVTPRVQLAFTRTFQFLRQWCMQLSEDAIEGVMPMDCISKEFRTAILANFEICRPGSTYFLQSKFSMFLELQGSSSVERLWTRASWGEDHTDVQFIVANLSHPDIKEIDPSKTEGDKRDREAEAIAATLDENYSDSADDVFCQERQVKVQSDGDGFGESRKVEFKSEPEDIKDVKREHEGPSTVSESDLYSTDRNRS